MKELAEQRGGQDVVYDPANKTNNRKLRVRFKFWINGALDIKL